MDNFVPSLKISPDPVILAACFSQVCYLSYVLSCVAARAGVWRRGVLSASAISCLGTKLHKNKLKNSNLDIGGLEQNRVKLGKS